MWRGGQDLGTCGMPSQVHFHPLAHGPHSKRAGACPLSLPGAAQVSARGPHVRLASARKACGARRLKTQVIARLGKIARSSMLTANSPQVEYVPTFVEVCCVLMHHDTWSDVMYVLPRCVSQIARRTRYYLNQPFTNQLFSWTSVSHMCKVCLTKHRVGWLD